MHPAEPGTSGTRPAARARRGAALRWWAGSLLTFLGLLAVLTQVPRVWGVEWFADHAGELASAIGPGWVAGTWYLWLRTRRVDAEPALPDPSRPVVAAPLAGRPDEAVRRARRRGRWGAVRQVAAVAVLPLLVVGALAEQRDAARDTQVLRTAPVRPAVVADVVRHPLDGSLVRLVVTVDGRDVRVDARFPGDDELRAGDPLDVVVDPQDPGRVLATAGLATWGRAWWQVGLLWLLFALVLVPAAWLRLPRPAAVRAALGARTATPAQVEAVHGATTLLQADGRWWTFAGQQPAAASVILLGAVRDGSWVVLDDGRTRLPSAPLRSADLGP
ncbi:hypothetical protein [Cellulomonas phragmiteti]|nr:hypothetical protein [Cellulomonas phragmiteti]